MSQSANHRPPYLVDLHMHSTCSDGQLPPEELVKLASERNLRVISITDHDTIDALKIAKTHGQDLGIRVIPGVEISAYFDREVHLLGYFFDPENQTLKSALEKQKVARIERVREICNRLDRLGYVVYPDQIIENAGASVGRPHVAQALVEAGHVRNMDDAFRRFLRNGGPAYVPEWQIDFRAAVEVIHEAGGVASIAHPGPDKLTGKIKALADLGLDAVEITHPAHSPSVSGQLRSIARQLKLLVTGGSDLHAPGGHWQLGSGGITETELSDLELKANEYRRV